MSKTGGQLDIKLVELGDDFSVLVPMNWTCARLDDHRWQCGDRDGIVQCFFRHEIAPPSTPPAYPLDHAQRVLAIVRDHFEKQGITGTIEERQTPSGGIIHVTTDDPEESGEVYRHARWYLVTGYSHGVSIFHLVLGALVENWDDPQMPRLVEHFASQAEAGAGTKSLITESLGLRDLRIGGPVVISVPATWSVRQDELRVIAKGADGLPTVIADVAYADDEPVVRAMSEAGPMSIPNLPELGLRAAAALADTMRFTVGSIDRAKYGAIIRSEFEPDAVEQLLMWRYVIPIDTVCLVANFGLTIPLGLRDQANMVEARAMMAREIANLRLEFDDED
jgi:hypothetical protein